MDVDGEALFSQPLMGHLMFTVFVNWALARAGNTQRLRQLGGEDVLGMGILAPGCIQPKPGGSGAQGSWGETERSEAGKVIWTQITENV